MDLSYNSFWDKLRKALGITKPVALPIGKWDEWHETLKRDHPVKYFLTETVQDFFDACYEKVVRPFRDARYYVVMRWINRTHVIVTDLKPGDFHEHEARVMHGLFSVITYYVETDLAWRAVQEGDLKKVAWHYRYRWTNWTRLCRPDLGIEYLRSDIAENSEIDGKAESIEIMTLYVWWKFIRPKRQDPYDITGLAAFFQEMKEKYGNALWFSKMSPSEKDLYKKLSVEVDEIETKREKEDEDMMIRVVRVCKAQHLWV